MWLGYETLYNLNVVVTWDWKKPGYVWLADMTYENRRKGYYWAETPLYPASFSEHKSGQWTGRYTLYWQSWACKTGYGRYGETACARARTNVVGVASDYITLKWTVYADGSITVTKSPAESSW